MSEALDYLLKIRPDALQSYFDFIKKSGKHLDKKTRAIISVITKVDNQTETGFRQYLIRAMQAGVTADEIIDALFTAFPTLGLSKIIWAIDIIIKLDIPEFRAENLGHKPQWMEISDLGKIQDGTTSHFVSNRDIFIYRKGKDVSVYDSHCPHQATNIPHLALKDNILTCPKHGWVFDVTSGNCLEKGDRPLRILESKIENNILYILV